MITIPFPPFWMLEKTERMEVPVARLLMTALKRLNREDSFRGQTIEDVYREVVKMAEEEYK